VQFFTRFLALSLVFTVALRAQPSLEHARGAQLMLGPDVWSRVIQIENRAHRSRYARKVYALVFELQGLLWFYTDADGTQSFSLHRDRLAAEKANFGPLLRDIEPGFIHWREVSAADLAQVRPSAQLRNGCFIESVALWRERAAQGVPLAEPRLLSFYIETAHGRTGHTVFAFRDGEAVKLIDPVRPEAVVSVPLAHATDPLRLAREFGGREVSKARVFPLESAKTASAAPVLALS